MSDTLKLDATERRLKARIKKHSAYKNLTLVRWYIDQLAEHLVEKDRKKEKANA